MPPLNPYCIDELKATVPIFTVLTSVLCEGKTYSLPKVGALLLLNRLHTDAQPATAARPRPNRTAHGKAIDIVGDALSGPPLVNRPRTNGPSLRELMARPGSSVASDAAEISALVADEKWKWERSHATTCCM